MRPFLVGAAGVMLAAAVSGCGHSATSPASPTVAPSGIVLACTISGNFRIPPGSTAQLRASAHYSNGAVSDVTSAVAWHSSDTTILTIDAAGVATGRQSGQANVTVALNGAGCATQPILVIPAGTFSLAGRVTWTGRDLEGASVQVTGGRSGAGLAAVTDGSGAYRLFGVAGAIQLTVTDPSYATIQQPATITGDTTLDFQMQSAGPVPQFSGTYSVQISADPACPSSGPQALPGAARVRRYTATNQGGDSNIQAAFSGASFLQQRNTMFGYVTPDGANLDVNNLDYYNDIVFPPPDFAEVLPDGTVFSPSGAIVLTASGADFTGTLDGTLFVRNPSSGAAVGQCTSTHHSLTFTKLSGTPAAFGTHR